LNSYIYIYINIYTYIHIYVSFKAWIVVGMFRNISYDLNLHCVHNHQFLSLTET
jgi:hypothetical protein